MDVSRRLNKGEASEELGMAVVGAAEEVGMGMVGMAVVVLASVELGVGMVVCASEEKPELGMGGSVVEAELYMGVLVVPLDVAASRIVLLDFLQFFN